MRKMHHEPRNWHTPHVWPSCSCGFDPHDNAALAEHWRERGLWYVDHRGTVEGGAA